MPDKQNHKMMLLCHIRVDINLFPQFELPHEDVEDFYQFLLSIP